MNIFKEISNNNNASSSINYIKINKNVGEYAKNVLVTFKIINSNYKITVDNDYLQIPIINISSNYLKKLIIKLIKKELKKGTFFEIETTNNSYFQKKKSKKKILDILGYNPKYEIIGDIAIINKEEKDIYNIGNCLLYFYSGLITTVLYSLTPVYGEFRIRKFTCICGVDKRETLYKENGCLYYINLEYAYFTQHLATDRRSLLRLINENEVVIDMFSGVGPYSILISKNINVKQIISIDKNPIAIKLLKKNILINKVKNIHVLEMNARDINKVYQNTADHIIMNLPQNSIDFIDNAIIACKKYGFIHYYSMTSKNDKSTFEEVILKIKNKALLLNKNIIITNKQIIRSYAPYQYNVRLDIQVLD